MILEIKTDQKIKSLNIVFSDDGSTSVGIVEPSNTSLNPQSSTKLDDIEQVLRTSLNSYSPTKSSEVTKKVVEVAPAVEIKPSENRDSNVDPNFAKVTL